MGGRGGGEGKRLLDVTVTLQLTPEYFVSSLDIG